jgi:hypothetical protein
MVHGSGGCVIEAYIYEIRKPIRAMTQLCDGKESKKDYILHVHAFTY